MPIKNHKQRLISCNMQAFFSIVSGIFGQISLECVERLIEPYQCRIACSLNHPANSGIIKYFVCIHTPNDGTQLSQTSISRHTFCKALFSIFFSTVKLWTWVFWTSSNYTSQTYAIEMSCFNRNSFFLNAVNNSH